MTPKRICNTFSKLRSEIQLTQSEVKLIKFSNNKRKYVRKLVGYEDIMLDMTNIPIIENNNCHPLKNNIEYTWANFIQNNKITKKPITISFTNFNLASMQEYLSYKNVDKIRVLLTKLSYSRIT